MLFGLTNALATFQAIINNILGKYLDNFVFAYLDNILIYSDDLDTYKHHIRRVLERLQKANLLVEPRKYHFHMEEVEFLGHVIRYREVSMQKSKVQAIIDWPRPRTIKEVRGFLGLCNYYRYYIKNHSTNIKALIDLTKNEQKWVWNEE